MSTSTASRAPDWSRFQIVALVTMRILIGWHFLYEGLAKLTNPYWTSAGYLAESQGWFSGIFFDIATNESVLTAVDYINIWGLIAVGLGLMLGAFTQIATVGGIVLLALYYLAAPPGIGLSYPMPSEGSYLIVNKVLIELAALVVLLAFPTGKVVGLDRLIALRGEPATRGKATV